MSPEQLEYLHNANQSSLLPFETVDDVEMVDAVLDGHQPLNISHAGGELGYEMVGDVWVK